MKNTPRPLIDSYGLPQGVWFMMSHQREVAIKDVEMYTWSVTIATQEGGVTFRI